MQSIAAVLLSALTWEQTAASPINPRETNNPRLEWRVLVGRVWAKVATNYQS
jgi:hypothetical protein